MGNMNFVWQSTDNVFVNKSTANYTDFTAIRPAKSSASDVMASNNSQRFPARQNLINRRKWSNWNEVLGVFFLSIRLATLRFGRKMFRWLAASLWSKLLLSGQHKRQEKLTHPWCFVTCGQAIVIHTTQNTVLTAIGQSNSRWCPLKTKCFSRRGNALDRRPLHSSSLLQNGGGSRCRCASRRSFVFATFSDMAALRLTLSLSIYLSLSLSLSVYLSCFLLLRVKSSPCNRDLLLTITQPILHLKIVNRVNKFIGE